MGRIEGKIAIVTGGNSGIGNKIAEVFLKEGAKVVITARRPEANAKAVEQLSPYGEVSAVDCDLSTPEGCRKAVDFAAEKYGRIDILVNSAGIADKHMSVINCSEEWYDTVCKIDQYAVFWMCKYALPYMEKQKKGSIVNISSIGSQGVAGISYSAAKAAVNAMTKNIAISYTGSEIRCNAVAPGPTQTPMMTPEAMKGFDAELAGLTAKHIDVTLPEALPEDQAMAALFFASDEAKAITGQILYVDHGSTMY